MKHALLLFWVIAVLLGLSAAQVDGLRARLRPNQILDYHFEGHYGFAPGHIPRFEEDTILYRGPRVCDYYFSAVVRLEIRYADANGTLDGTANYLSTQITQWQCPDLDRTRAEAQLAAMRMRPMPFALSSRGEITFPAATEEQLDFRGPFRLLTSSTLDLLHTVLADAPVALNQVWRPRENFIYWKEYTDTGLELTAATAKYARQPKVAGDQCAQVDLKYVYAPQDVAASASTPKGRVRAPFAGTVAGGMLRISVLLDLSSGHIAWIHRAREINNRLYLGGYTEDERRPLIDFRLTEEFTVRQLRKESPLEWNAAIKNFEESGKTEPPNPPASNQGPLISAAIRAKARRAVSTMEEAEPRPRGYTRYEKSICLSTWSCTAVSIALPSVVQVTNDTPERATYLAMSGAAQSSISIGPVQMKISRGLMDREELKKNALAFLIDKLWLDAGVGTPITSSDTYVEDYPALVTDFTTSLPQQVQMQGKLATILTAWGEIVSVGCAYPQADAATQESVCNQVLGSIRVRHIEPQ